MRKALIAVIAMMLALPLIGSERRASYYEAKEFLGFSPPTSAEIFRVDVDTVIMGKRFIGYGYSFVFTNDFDGKVFASMLDERFHPIMLTSNLQTFGDITKGSALFVSQDGQYLLYLQGEWRNSYLIAWVHIIIKMK